MGYLKIPNLYADQAILQFRECYALEKIHGTSAHLKLEDGQLHLYGGGIAHEKFAALFAGRDMAAVLGAVADDITLFGEAYGGSCQKMADVYGPELRFVVFDVQIGGMWLAVPNAAGVAEKCGLEFVWHERIEATLPAIDAARDRPSEQARRNCGHEKFGEGVVLRPVFEMTRNDGKRIIAKHKRAEFRETKTDRSVDPNHQVVLDGADAFAEEWVTPMRLEHVLDKIQVGSRRVGIEETGVVINAVLGDVLAECVDSVNWSKEVQAAVKRRAALLFKKTITTVVAR